VDVVALAPQPVAATARAQIAAAVQARAAATRAAA
jgi:hypothetical protein